MKNTIMAAKSIFLLILALAISSTASPGYADDYEDYRFSREELTQMISPIALYPDSLLSQVLMASTYPIEIVEAERWLKKNKKLKEDRLNRELLDKDWDTSIKSLCHFRDVLYSMSDKIDQTRRLGDAFLVQEEEMMDIVQELRRIAYRRGNLKSTREQKVILEGSMIRIEPSFTQVVYVPVYDPMYVYGQWPYPSYAPYYWYYPYSYSIRYIHFGSPVSIGIEWFAWTWFDWPSLRIIISWDHSQRYHRHYNVHRVEPLPYWYHDPFHRRGVAYRDRNTRERFTNRPPRTGQDYRERPYTGDRENPGRPRPTGNPPENDRLSDRDRYRERDVTPRTSPGMPAGPGDTDFPERDRPQRPSGVNERQRDDQDVPAINQEGRETNSPVRERPQRPSGVNERQRDDQDVPAMNQEERETNSPVRERPSQYRDRRENSIPPSYRPDEPSMRTDPPASSDRNQYRRSPGRDRNEIDRQRDTSSLDTGKNQQARLVPSGSAEKRKDQALNLLEKRENSSPGNSIKETISGFLREKIQESKKGRSSGEDTRISRLKK